MWLFTACSTPFSIEAVPPATDSGDTAAAVSNAPLELCVNELMPDNQASASDETGAWPDWIELHNPGAEPVGLEGWALSDDEEEPDKHLLGADLALAPGEFLLLWADEATDLGASHLGFRLGGEGGSVSLRAPDGRASVVRYGLVSPDFSVARSTDCCEGDGCLGFSFRGTPGTSNVPTSLEDVAIVAAETPWRYLDTGVFPGDGWTLSEFDDSAWAEGAGVLGYGDSQATVVSYGADPNAKYVTTWFRRSFVATEVEALAGLELGLVRDDGAVVYLNGAEVLRSNLPEGTVDASTFATTSVSDSAEASRWAFDIEPSLLLEGPNVLAVEVHQADATSSDLSFDLSLVGERER